MGYDERAETIMRQYALAGDMLWGAKEWVKWQIQQVEDIEIQKELKQYTYLLAMIVYFLLAEEFHIIQAGDYPGYIKFNYQLIEPEKYGYMVEDTAEERLEVAFNWMSDIKFEDGE